MRTHKKFWKLIEENPRATELIQSIKRTLEAVLAEIKPDGMYGLKRLDCAQTRQSVLPSINELQALYQKHLS